MPHGQPDFGMYGIASTIYRLADMGELAARLGSICTFDRRGNVICLDSFESGLSGFVTSGAGTGYSVSQSGEYSRNGGFSAKMVCGSDGSRRAEIWKKLPYPVLHNLGVEISFTMTEDIEWFQVFLRVYNGTEYLQGMIYFDEDNSILKYFDEDGVYQDLETGLALYEYPSLFHSLKFVVDYENNKYKRVLLDERSWDLEGINIYHVADTTKPHMAVTINAQGKVVENATIYVDDFIVTQNEP